MTRVSNVELLWLTGLTVAIAVVSIGMTILVGPR